MITINLKDTYEVESVTRDLKNFVFRSELRDETLVEIHVVIYEHPDELLPNVFNLGFGSLNEHNEIDDSVRVNHKSVNKVFSTVLLFGITFLQENPLFSIGIDGSDDLRAYLYHRMFRYNIRSLKEVMLIVGVDWYVKLLRNRTDIERDGNGLPFFKPRPEPFDLERSPDDLYRYYIYSLNLNSSN